MLWDRSSVLRLFLAQESSSSRVFALVSMSVSWLPEQKRPRRFVQLQTSRADSLLSQQLRVFRAVLPLTLR